MFCANCGIPLASGLSFCNRCGAILKEEPKNSSSISAYLTAITLIGVIGLGIMLGGAVVLRKEADLPVEFSAFFMLFTFLIVGTIEVMLIRSLSKLTSPANKGKYLPPAQPAPHELRLPLPGSLGEPVASVTENTTRTLEYSRREQ